MAKNSVTLIVPILNEEKSLPLLFDRLDPALAAIKKNHKGLQFKLLFVDDGSTDASALIVRKAKLKHAKIQMISLTRNFGKESALFAGLNHCKTDAAIPMDVDLQDPPEVIDEMITEWRAGADIVDAKRASRSEDSVFQRVTAAGFYRVFNIFSERAMPENVGDFRLFDREVVAALKQIGDKKRFNKEIFSWVGFKTAQVEFARPARAAGASRHSFWRLWNMALDGIFSASTVPLRFWSYVGFMVALFTFLYLLFVILYTLAFGREVPGYSSTIVAVLFFGGLNLLSVGIMGEYIGRIYAEVRNRPNYLIKDSFGLDDE